MQGHRRGGRARRARRARSAAAPASSAIQQGFLVVARTCGQCGGTGQIVRNAVRRPAAAPDASTQDRRVTVRIPAGIADGQRLRLHGEGEHGALGGPTGDLYVVDPRPAAPVVPSRRRRPLRRRRRCRIPIMAMGGSFKVDGPGGRDRRSTSRPARASGTLIPLPRQGHAERDRPRPRRAFTSASSSTCRASSRKDQKKLVEQLGTDDARREASSRRTADRRARQAVLREGAKISSARSTVRRRARIPP